MKRILSHLREDWYKYTLEIIVITVGILGAYALNNWNEQVNNQKRAMKLLRGLQTEFLANQAQLTTIMGYHLDVENSSTLLLRSINNNVEMSEDSLKYHFMKISEAWTFDPQNSVLRSSISSGDIHLIENDELLSYLFGWTDLALDAREEEKLAADHYTNILLPFSYEYVMETDLISHYYQTEQFKSRYSSDYIGMVYNRNFENMMALRLEYTLSLLRELRPIQKMNSAILVEINKSLNNEDQ